MRNLANISVAANKRQKNPKGQLRMENPETRDTLEASHRTKTIKQAAQQRILRWWPIRTLPDMNPCTARRVNRYTYTSLMKKNQKKSCICSLDRSSFLYMSNLVTEIMILLSVPSYTVKQNYDAVNSIMWPTIQWKWYTVRQLNFFTKMIHVMTS